MTDLEKRIYNCWLATTRSKTGKPFKLRKKWEDFTDKPEYSQIKKLAKMFKSYDNININEWFEAPYVVYPEKVQYDLKFYTLMKAYNIFRLYKQKINKTKYTPQEFVKILRKKVDKKQTNI